MKKLIYISLFASLFFVGCEKSPVANNSGIVENEILLPVGGEYIQFNSEALTRGTLINGGTLQDKFDVLGYKYASTWETFKVQAKPNVFPRKIGNTTYDHVETIRYANGYHEYSDPVEWTADNYSFFAYYPSAANDLISTSEADYEGAPYIEYTLDVANVANHVDVMTACNKDTRKQASKHGVNLSMQHRLSALDFVGYSYVDARALNSLGWANIPADKLDETPVEIIINSLSISLNNLKYNKARISLDESQDLDNNTEGVQAMIPSAESHQANPSFTYVVGSDPLSFRDGVSAYLSSQLNGDKEKGCPMILIPQDRPLTCSVSISYSIKVGDTVIASYGTTEPITATTDIPKLDEKVYNYILLAFTKTGLYLKAEQGTQWKEINVNHQFE